MRLALLRTMQRRRRAPFVITVALAATVACGSTSEDGQPDGGSGADGGGTGGVTGGSGGLGGLGGFGGVGGPTGDGGSSANPPYVPCPTALPEDGGPCEPDEYAGDYACFIPDPCGDGADVSASCTGGKWVVADIECQCVCPEWVPKHGDSCNPCYVDSCYWGGCRDDLKHYASCVDGVWETTYTSCFPPKDGGIAFDATVTFDAGSLIDASTSPDGGS